MQSSSFDRSQIEEIKQRINIEDVVKRYVKLKPVGKNMFGLCPFHKEDSPSFSVNTEINIYKCFGCGESGDVITFLMKIENMEFQEALSQLAREAGVELKAGKYDPEKTKKFLRAKQAHLSAADFYHYVLTKHKTGEKGRNYISGRKLLPKTVEEFKIGYASYSNTRTVLLQFLKKKGFTASELEEYGLVATKNGRTRDRFTDRIMFPIFSPAGDIIAFSGRIITKEDIRPKYINTPETPIFQKRKNLFGLYQSKKAIREDQFVILVEGQTDVASSWQNEIQNIVAPLGTSITTDQLRKVKRFTPNIAVSFDRDNAGLIAGLRATALAYEIGFNVSAIEIPVGNDADECIRNDPELWRNAVNKRKPAVTFFSNRLISEIEPTSLEAKQKIVKQILPLISVISDKVIKDHHIKEISELTGISEGIIRETVSQKKPGHKIKDLINNSVDDERVIPVETYLLSLLLQYPENIAWISDKIDLNEIENNPVKSILQKLVKYHRGHKKVLLSEFISKLDGEEKVLSEDSTMRPLWVETPNNEEIAEEIAYTITKIKKNYIHKQISELKTKLRSLEKEKDTKAANEVLNLINNQIKELNAISSPSKDKLEEDK